MINIMAKLRSPAVTTDPEAIQNRVRLDRISINNFKAIDRVDIAFRPRILADEPDVFVMGSRNGLGKTSVLEATSLLFIAALVGDQGFSLRRYLPEFPLDIPDLLVRSGGEDAEISGTFTAQKERIEVSVVINRRGDIKVRGVEGRLRSLLKAQRRLRTDPEDAVIRFFRALAGLNAEPIILPPFLYFHSYRKVQEGNPELSMMLERDPSIRYHRMRSRAETPISSFKVELLRSLMSRGGLFEDLEDTDSELVLRQLNELMKVYAGGVVEKLRPSPDNTLDFRIRPMGGRPPFTFDGLSSGQKEIISTLFLVWQYTRNMPGIVLVDEPEMHLNPEWHAELVRQLFRLVPNNQYILATHSEDIFASVEPSNRILLSR